MPESLIPARVPQTTDLMQARKILMALREYLETPDGMAMAGTDFVDLHSAITMIDITLQRLTVARPMV
jgi:hypothetical protein